MTIDVQWLPRLEKTPAPKIGGLFYGYGGLDLAVHIGIPQEYRRAPQ